MALYHDLLIPQIYPDCGLYENSNTSFGLAKMDGLSFEADVIKAPGFWDSVFFESEKSMNLSSIPASPSFIIEDPSETDMTDCSSPRSSSEENFSQEDTEIEPDGILYLDKDHVIPDGVCYLTDERQFVSVDSHVQDLVPNDWKNSFDPTELYFAPDRPTDTNFVVSAPISELRVPISEVKLPTAATPVSQCIQSPCFSLREPTTVPYVEDSATDRSSMTLEIQSTVWGGSNRSQYFVSQLRRSQLLRYREKKARRFQFKRPVDPARSRVAKLRMRNSKGRFVTKH